MERKKISERGSLSIGLAQGHSTYGIGRTVLDLPGRQGPVLDLPEIFVDLDLQKDFLHDKSTPPYKYRGSWPIEDIQSIKKHNNILLFVIFTFISKP